MNLVTFWFQLPGCRQLFHYMGQDYFYFIFFSSKRIKAGYQLIKIIMLMSYQVYVQWFFWIFDINLLFLILYSQINFMLLFPFFVFDKHYYPLSVIELVVFKGMTWSRWSAEKIKTKFSTSHEIKNNIFIYFWNGRLRVWYSGNMYICMCVLGSFKLNSGNGRVGCAAICCPWLSWPRVGCGKNS